MKILTFIGANGFIGKSLLDSFNRGRLKKFKIKKLYLISRNIRELKKLNFSKNVVFIKNDMSKIKKLPNSDYFIYGAEKAEIKSKKNYNSIIINSKKSIENFCNIVKKQKKAKVLYLSSGIINKLKKKSKKIKSSKEAYSNIKHYSESQIKKLTDFKIKTSIARCYTFLGVWLPRNSKYAIGNFLDNILKNKPIKIKKKNKVFRSYMYADDMIDWIIKICKVSSFKTKVYDVGSDQKIEIEDLAKLFSKLFKNKIKFTKMNYNYKKIDKYLPNLKTAKKLDLKLNYKLKEAIIITIKRLNEQTH